MTLENNAPAKKSRMSKLTKGAIATGVGVMILVGGGGTLATWNASNHASMGTIVAGELDLRAQKGEWTNAMGQRIYPGTYKIVPGEVLTFTQPLTVHLSGDLMRAKLKIVGAGVDSGFGASATVGAITLTKDGLEVPPTAALKETDSGAVTASTTFTFHESTQYRTSVGASYDFSSVGYSLEQLPPASL